MLLKYIRTYISQRNAREDRLGNANLVTYAVVCRARSSRPLLAARVAPLTTRRAPRANDLAYARTMRQCSARTCKQRIVIRHMPFDCYVHMYNAATCHKLLCSMLFIVAYLQWAALARSCFFTTLICVRTSVRSITMAASSLFGRSFGCDAHSSNSFRGSLVWA